MCISEWLSTGACDHRSGYTRPIRFYSKVAKTEAKGMNHQRLVFPAIDAADELGGSKGERYCKTEGERDKKRRINDNYIRRGYCISQKRRKEEEKTLNSGTGATGGDARTARVPPGVRATSELRVPSVPGGSESGCGAEGYG